MLGWSEGGEKPSDTEESQGYIPPTKYAPPTDYSPPTKYAPLTNYSPPTDYSPPTEESHLYIPKIPFPGKLMQIPQQFTLEEFQPYLYSNVETL